MSGDKPQPAVLRIKLRYKSLDAFIEKFAENVSHGGIFISTKQLKPVGTDVRFELLLADGSPAIKGEGRVAFVREFDPDEPHGAFGMGIKLTKLVGKSREVLKKCIDWKSTHKKAADSSTENIPVHTGQFELPEGQPSKAETPAPVEDLATLPELDALVAEAGLDDAKLVAALAHLKGQAQNGVADGELDDLLKKDPQSTVTVDDATAELARMLGGAPVRRRGELRHPLAEANDFEDEVAALTPPPGNLPLPDLYVDLYRDEERPAVAANPAQVNTAPAVPAKEIGADVASVLDAIEREVDQPSDTSVDPHAPLFVGRGIASEAMPVDPALYDDLQDGAADANQEQPPPTADSAQDGPEKRKSGFFKKLFGK